MNKSAAITFKRPIAKWFGAGAKIKKRKGDSGIWIGREFTLTVDDAGRGKWLILEGSFFEGIDQLSEARAEWRRRHQVPGP